MVTTEKKRIGLVTGCGGFGIGFGIVSELARSGKFGRIFIHYGRKMRLRAEYKQLSKETGVEFVFVKRNFSVRGAGTKLAQKIIEKLDGQKIDHISLVAAITFYGDFFDYDEKDWHKAFDTNTVSAIMLVAGLVKDHMSEDLPNIVIISTNHALGTAASGAHPMYACTKHGLTGLLGSFVRLFGQHGLRNGVRTKVLDDGHIVKVRGQDAIRANVICPGWTMSQRQADAHNDPENDLDLTEVAAEMPTGLINNPEDIGKAAVFFDSMPVLNGALLEMTNGITSVFPGKVEKLKL